MGNRIDRRFDLLKTQANQEANKQQQKAGEDIDRQSAARGRLGSGVGQKLKVQANTEIDQGRRQAVEGVESMREQALGQQEELQANRDFQAKESGLNRAFAAQESALGRGFATSERLGSQDFAAGQTGAQRDFDKFLFDKQMKFNKQAQTLQNKQFKDQLSQSKVLAEKQLEMDEWATKFNMDMAAKQAGKNPGLLGGGGFLGTGIGGGGKVFDTSGW